MDSLAPALVEGHCLKILILVHSTLVSISVILAKFNSWHVTAYISYNLIFIITLLLSLVDETHNVDTILLATAFNVVCMLLDIVFLVTAGSSYLSFPAMLLMILNLLFRIPSTILLVKNYSARAGVSDPTAGLLEVEVQGVTQPVTRAKSAYQNIDTVAQNQRQP